MTNRTTLSLLTLLALSLPTQAAAFCGFYVSGADQKMFNDATQVVMMREGTKTVLSMRNTYEGPPTDFAMVVPVPVVLKKDEVKVLNDAIFDKVDALTAPRLVEYWERDPCPKPVKAKMSLDSSSGGIDSLLGDLDKSSGGATNKRPAVRVAAKFVVGEYDVVVLSADESNALETWLVQNKYNIPKGAAKALAPYIQQGMYFFVAKVDPKKVTFKDGRAVLSPLRFHYDSKDFQLPVRLGMLNAKGAQDLIVNIIAPNQRYEVANRPNVTIPTNLVVKARTKKSFGAFYNALFDYTLEANPGAVVTEYAWQATKCDPCPDGSFSSGGLMGPLSMQDLMVLGGDVLHEQTKERAITITSPGKPDGSLEVKEKVRRRRLNPSGFVITRLHTRYTPRQPMDDLIFTTAGPIVGGTGTPTNLAGDFDVEGVQKSSFNRFQGRYVILNEWDGKMACKNPRRGMWGGPPNRNARRGALTADDVANLPRKKKTRLSTFMSKSSRAGVKEQLGK
jgi:hypothetical protein